MSKGITAIAGKDSLILSNGIGIISGFADGDAVKCDFAGPIAEMKVSKDGNSIYAMKYTGIGAKLTLRLVRGCLDDTNLNGLLQQWIADSSGFNLFTGSYVKRVGDGKGNVINEVYQLAGGVFETIPSAHSSMDGAVESSVTVYTFLFRNDARLMQ